MRYFPYAQVKLEWELSVADAMQLTSRIKVHSWQLRAVAFIIGATAYLAIALAGTDYGEGGGFINGQIQRTHYFEHGWPFIIGERRDSAHRNRFAVWSGITRYDGKSIALNALIGSFVLVCWGAIIAKVRYSLKAILAGVFVMAIPLAHVAAIIHSCQMDRAMVKGLPSDRIEVIVNYVGPLWLQRLTGEAEPFGVRFLATKYVRLHNEGDLNDQQILSQLVGLPFLKAALIPDGREVPSSELSQFAANLGNVSG